MYDAITRLGNYRLTRLLGQGGFAEVYLGEHIHLKTQAAIKVLQAQLSGSDRDSFIKEAQIIASLVHPQIVRVLEFGIENDIPFLVMDYAPGGALRQTMGKPLPLPLIVSYVKQAASALQYAHDRKIIHRDVKPENMLLRQRDELLLSDFGIALVAQSSRYQSRSPIAAGTISYMAPEQLQGHPSPASDQYALGITVYEWLCGERPFKGSYTEVGSQHMFATPPPLRAKVPTLPPGVEDVVFTALAKEPQHRFSNVQIFAQSFERAYQGTTIGSDSSKYSTTFPIARQIPYNQPSSPNPVVSPVQPGSSSPPNSIVSSPQSGQPSSTNPTILSSPPTSTRPASTGKHIPTQPAPPPHGFSSYPPPAAYPPGYPPMAPYASIPVVMTAPPKRKGSSGCCIALAVTMILLVLLIVGGALSYALVGNLGLTTGTNSPGIPDARDASAQTGAILYSEQGADHWSGWLLKGEWKTLDGALLSDGTGASQYGTSYGNDTIWAPHQVGVQNYAVQASIQITKAVQYCYFALVGRATSNNNSIGSSNYTNYNGYAAGISSGYTFTGPDLEVGIVDYPMSSSSSSNIQYNPGGQGHSYRVEFFKTSIKLKIDNKVIAQTDDSKFLNGGMVGLQSGNCQLAISNFSIIKL